MSDTPERIYLVDGEWDGTVTKVWCDDPAPSVDHDASEAAEYVRADVHEQRVAELERYNVGLANESSAQQEQITGLKNALTQQAKAATQGMDAAKAAAYTMEQNASRMYAECNPEALESERASNATLTERIAELEAHVARFHALANLANLMSAKDVCDELVSIDDDTPSESLAIAEAIRKHQAQGADQ